jgi:predicted ATPase
VITEFHAKDYGPLKDVSCKLTPLHAFIGPNDSGKSMLLRALVSSIRGFAAGDFDGLSAIFTLNFDSWIETAISNKPETFAGNFDPEIRKWLRSGARICRFDADALRQPSALMDEPQALEFVSNRGYGLAGVLDILNNRADDALREISSGMTTLFPSLARIQLRNIPPQKQVAAQLADGTRIDAAAMSEGILYYLAYACVRAIGGGALLAVEEPETGLHPARIAQVVQILREISKTGTQVIIATHSPLVINELQPNEVSIVTRSAEKGTQITQMFDTADFVRRSKVYALGELWLSYANGDDEGPLLKGGPREILRNEDAPEDPPKT